MIAEAELVLAIAEEIVYDKYNSRISTLVKKDNINWSKFKDSLVYHGLVPFCYLGLHP